MWLLIVKFYEKVNFTIVKIGCLES